MKIKSEEKVKYMFWGALLVFVAFVLGCMRNIPTHPDHLDVQSLIVRDRIIVTDNLGNPVVGISQNENGGIVAIHGKGGEGGIIMRIDTEGGEMSILPKRGNGSVVIKTADGDGTLRVKSNEGSDITLVFQSGDGALVIRGKDGKSGAGLGISEGQGFGYISDRGGEIHPLD